MTAAAPTPAPAGITVVVPTYNGSACIGQALRSVFSQTELPAAIIVVDDCSTDDTCNLARGLERESPVPLQVLKMPRNTGSPALPINAGVEAATTDYVALLEHDDLMLPERLRLQRAALERFPACGMAIGRLALFEEKPDGSLGWEAPVAEHADLAALYAANRGGAFEVPARTAFRALVTANFVYTNSNITLRRSAWAKYGGYTVEWPRNNDAEFEFRWFAQAPVAVVDQLCCGYRRTPGSLYHSNWSRSKIDGNRLRLEVLARHPGWSEGLAANLRRTLRQQARESLAAGHAWTAARIAWDLLRYRR